MNNILEGVLGMGIGEFEEYFSLLGGIGEVNIDPLQLILIDFKLCLEDWIVERIGDKLEVDASLDG